MSVSPKTESMTVASQSRAGERANLRDILSSTAVRVVVLTLCFLWSLPTVGLLISSFRPAAAINQSGWWTVFYTPFNFTLDNYQAVLTAEGMGEAFLNSLIVTIPSVVIPITIAAFAAYAFAWLQFPGRDLFFATVVILMVVPLHTALVPILRMYTGLDLNGTFLGIWLAHTGFGLPLAIYLLYGYIVTIPKEMMEAVVVDGATPFTTFTRMILPLSIPAIASFTIFQFLWVWNDLLVALVFLGTNDEVVVVTRKLTELVGSKGQNWEVLTAGAFVTMFVPLLVFFALQRYFVRGMMAGSVKG
jgi:alpha-glucoside transport system permease protein